MQRLIRPGAGLLLAAALWMAACDSDDSPPGPSGPLDLNAAYSDRHDECAYWTDVTDVVSPDPARFLARRHRGPYGEMNYRLFVPDPIDPDTAYPLVLLLHGGGARGPDNELQLAGVGPYLFASEQVQQEHPSLVLVPKIEAIDGAWATDVLRSLSVNLLSVLDIVGALQREFPVDADRLYVLGGSLGGAGTWDLATKAPGTFAAYVPFAAPIRWAWLLRGERKSVQPAAARALRGLNLWFLYGENDGNFGLKPWWDEIAGYLRAAGEDPMFTEYVNGEHVISTCVFTEPELLVWLFSQRLGKGQ